ncbi:hypothetical protein Plhal304r1_c002g0007061 [Plasmopara halstedii]
MQLIASLHPRCELNTQPSASYASINHVDLDSRMSVERLVSHAKQTPDTAELLQLLDQAHILQLQPFHYAAAIGDRKFYKMMIAFLPLDTFLKEILALSQSGLSAIQCARMLESSLATEVTEFLLSCGVILTQESQNFVMALSNIATLPNCGRSRLEDPHLNRVEVGSERYMICSKTASSVGLTLRANGIHYAATKAVYVQQVCSHALKELAFYGDKLLAFSKSDTTMSVGWTGAKIADLAFDESFRASFRIFSPCRDASQRLAPGMLVVLDLENLSPPPSKEEDLMILRLYPTTGTVETRATTSSSGVCVLDIGYPDDVYLKGFRRGWYSDVHYARCVGDDPNVYLSMSDASQRYKYNIREEHDWGYDNTRVMIELPDEGIVFCRGVGDDVENPKMACVLFDKNAKIRERYAYRGKLGRWNDIVQ